MVTPSPWPSWAVGDPKFRHNHTLQRSVGVPFMLLCDLIGHFPSSGSCGSNRSIPRRGWHRSQTFYQWMAVYTSRALGLKQSGFHLSTRALQHSILQHFRIVAAFRVCYCSLYLSASHIGSGMSFQVLPAPGGDMTVCEMAHTIYPMNVQTLVRCPCTRELFIRSF